MYEDIITDYSGLENGDHANIEKFEKVFANYFKLRLVKISLDGTKLSKKLLFRIHPGRFIESSYNGAKKPCYHQDITASFLANQFTYHMTGGHAIIGSLTMRF